MLIILLIISIPSYFFFQYFFKGRIENIKKRKKVILISTIIFTAVAYAIYIFSFICYITKEPSRKFDKKIWKENINERFKMKESIMELKIPIGKDSNSIKELLGEPIRSESIAKNWSYDMGSGVIGFGVAFRKLSITFENNKVTKVDFFQIND